MANRPVRIITKRTSVSGKTPTGTTGTELNFIQVGELATNLSDKKMFSYDGSNVFEFGSNSFLGLTGGTVTGNTSIVGTLSAGTFISGSTNLYSIFQTIGAVDSDPFLNLSGGTVTGTTNFISGLSANTFSGGTIYSGNTNLSDIFHQKNGYLLQKSGTVSGSTFSGNPKKATITFSTNFTGINYSITISSDTNRTFTWESKTLSGFTINANANTAFGSGNVDWTVTEQGEGYR